MGLSEKGLGPAYTRARLRIPNRFEDMNGIETEWAHLLDLDPEVAIWRYEKFKVELAPKTWYTVDFWVLYRNGWVECHEVKQVHRATKKQRDRAAAAGNPEPKGSTGWKEDARVKFKAAAAAFPELRWVACEKQLEGSWSQTVSDDLFKRTKR